MLKALPQGLDPNLLVSFDTSDDACVYKLQDKLALIQTVDFFPPIVDDPYFYGQIAAANALSDIYAMGACPSIALNILCIPACLPRTDVASILAGGAQKVREAGAVIAGGHSVEDEEPKYGLCVSAFIDPVYIWSNAGACVGDILVLTKPLGNGILATAAKRDKITQAEFQPAVESMAALNKYTRDAAVNGCVGVHACTDVTGFGLLGHAYEMAEASGCTLEFASNDFPLFEGVYHLAEEGVVPGGAERNANYLAGKISFAADVPLSLRSILYDPQTSGGLLLSIPEKDINSFAGMEVAVVGRVCDRQSYSIKVS
jgi:selenide,water dikinase